ncbi:Alpha crystallin/Hsp20 domain-containing protein [Cinnamomum micranthum f. kanehirae]|uniref:Alpha crystallin/Hsp20 domain-containing protein n=1 Tax=Cinnamomum micranthum f. kanehirae TaxID=337451 RepID=A0A3S3MBA6_9MAGN|nr:Alpha crystallin/Hsp20 domain-containing protein [Cinnamomum micranthum f. kanehirae]
MERKPLSISSRTYEDFQPPSDWVREEKSDTVVLHLPGFRKEQLRVQLDNSNNYLKVTGERLIDGTSNKWSRFRKEFRTPNDCNVNAVTAKFENATLYLIMPKDTSDTLPIGDQPIATTALEKKKSQGGSGSLPGTSEATSGRCSLFRRGGGLMSGMQKKRVLVVSVMVVVVAVGVYAAYKHFSIEKNED